MPPNHSASGRMTIIQRIGYSIFPAMAERETDRNRVRGLFNSLLLHFRPRKVDQRTLRLSLTWGLGGSAVVLVALLFLSGILLKFVYQPVADRAYESILYLQSAIAFGRLVRNVHHWSANLLIVAAFLHLLRTFFTGAFHPPRQFNWIIGLVLFLAILVSNFTGYLLPWDQLAYWAVTICAGMLDYLPGVGAGLKETLFGGSEMGPKTLAIFFALHTAVLPAALLVLMPFHFWRIRKAGGLVVPRTPEEPPQTRGESVATIPDLIIRELAAAAVVVGFIFILAAFFDAPLGARANPGLSPNPTKAPWYFAGLQELLFHFHPFFAVFVIPIFLLCGLLCIPYLSYETHSAGVWFASRTGRKTAFLAVFFALAVVPAAVIVDEFLVDWSAWLPDLPKLASHGFLPAAILSAALFIFYRLLRGKFAATRNDTVQAVFVFLAMTAVLLTLACFWFRAAGMSLAWPWSIGSP